MTSITSYRPVPYAIVSAGAASFKATTAPTDFPESPRDTTAVAVVASMPPTPVAVASARGFLESRGASPLVGRRILVVDDQACILEVVTPLLEEWGLAVEATTDSEEALRRLRENPPGYYDLLMTDLVMPRVTGVDLLNDMLARGRFVRTLVLSGSQGNRQVAALLEDLSGEDFEAIPVPLVYLKKDHDDFPEKLRRRLEFLCRKPVVPLGLIGERVLHFKELVRVESASDEAWARDTRRLAVMATAINHFIDLHFSVMNQVHVLVRGIRSYVDTLPDSERKAKLIKNLGKILVQPRPQREEILCYNAFEWHSFKGQNLDLKDRACAILEGLKRIEAPEEVLADAQSMQDVGMVLGWAAYATAHLRKVGDKIVKHDISYWMEFTKLEELLQRISLGRLVFDIPHEHRPLDVAVDESFFQDVLTQLVTNARQAQDPHQMDPQPMILRVRLIPPVSADAQYPQGDFLEVRPPDFLEPPRKPGMNYFYVGVLIPVTNRAVV